MFGLVIRIMSLLVFLVMNHSETITSEIAVMSGSSMQDFYVGLILATSSTIFIGTSFIFTKKGLLQLSVRAGNKNLTYSFV